MRAQLVHACDTFVAAYPRDDDAPAFALRAALASLAAGNTQATRARAEALLRRWPDGDVAMAAEALLQQTAPTRAP